MECFFLRGKTYSSISQIYHVAGRVHVGCRLQDHAEIHAKVGTPSVAVAEAITRWEANFDFSWTKTDITTQRCSSSLVILIPPYSIIRARATAQTGWIKVPFTVTYITETKAKLTSGGLWYGISSWSTSVDFKEASKIEHDENVKAVGSV
ncbi:hypothetical protein BKA59DRAFT_447852 [Fusarium tricinctum]|uniref:Uncharacterized protein n=1 Tax=Fusarium tricinctum TaxID=61284 RepID=A0A8K0WH69_9HYPO|nr:hypothetical protein BKA59DRAFT_447852 [Fusarium tricinctum]